MPTWGEPAGAFYGGSSFNVTKGSKNPAAAAKFIQYLATNPKAIEARGNGGAAVIAFPGLTAVAQKAFDSSFYGNDIYEVFAAAYKNVTPGWQWGPNWEITKTAIGDAYGKLTTGGTIGGAITSAQKATVEGLKQSRPVRHAVAARRAAPQGGARRTEENTMATQAPAAPVRRKRTATGNSGKTAAVFLTPFFAVFAVAMVAPVFYSIWLSFFSERKSGLGFGDPVTTFVGLENYVQVLQSESFVSGLLRLAMYCAMYIPAMVGGAVVFALLLDASVAKAKKMFQLLVFLPHAVPGVIAALIWAYLYTPGISPLVQALASGGIQINFLDAHMVLPSVVNIAVWEWTGYNVIILFTALQAVPREILGGRPR